MLKAGVFFKSLFGLTLFTLVLGQFASISKSQGLNLYAFDLVVGLYSILGIWYLYKSFGAATLKDSLLKSPLILLFLFTAWGVFSLLVAFNEGNLDLENFAKALFYPVRFLTYLIAVFNTLQFVQSRIIEKSFVIKSVLVSGLVFLVAGFIQLLLLPDFTVLDPSLGWDPHKNRMASTLFDPNFLGMLFVILLGFALSYRKFLYAPFLALGVLMTFSRSAWLALAVLVMTMGLRFRKLFLVSILLVFSAYFSVPRIQTRIANVTDPADSAAFRLISWQNALEIFSENKMIGVGFNSYRYAQERYGFIQDGVNNNSAAGADSSILFVLATTGAVGFFFFISYFYLYGVNLFSTRDFVRLGILFALLIESFFINSLFYPQILFIYLLYFGLVQKPRLR